MEELRKKRTVARRFFTIAEKDVLVAFSDSGTDLPPLIKYFEAKAEDLFDIDDKIKDLLFQSDADDEIIFSELESAEEYKRRYHKVRAKLCIDSHPVPSVSGENFDGISGTVKHNDNVRTFKLPVLELKKFDGQPMNWITFWGQFKRIHDDNHIDDFDKFRYLIQSTEPYSKARQFIESFPPSGENYSRAFRELKERFARDDLLIETYIRDLLKLVIRPKDDTSLSELYDTLSSHLHALESLGVTTDKYAAMLLPMVESAIPLDILKAWERSRDKSSKPDLNQLLSYIKAEVESEERICAARQGFDHQASTSKQPTAACIVAHTKAKDEKGSILECIFCQKGHTSVECYKLSKLTLDGKRELLREKKACFICFRIGHGTKTCRSFPKCMICNRRHFVAMCPRLENIKSQKPEEDKSQSKAEAMLCLRKPKTTFLQTVIVKIVYNGKNVITRALIDSGAQRSYITDNIIKNLGMKASGKESVTHCLFGGFQTKGAHDIYDFEIQNLDGQFSLNVRALCQKKICGALPRLLDRSMIDKLKSSNITINDSQVDISEVGLLIGADISGLLLLGHIVHIEGSLVAIDTKLGWTLQGQTCNVAVSCANVVSCLMNCTLSDLWDLDLLGIRDPYEVAPRQKCEYETLKFFRDTVSRDLEGRYEVHLPWKDGFPEMLPGNNKELAYKRLLSTTKKLKSTGNLARYDKVFEDWLTEGIIEIVEDGSSSHGLYLYHHAVVKESSATTPVRPVFDASAKLQGHSLNTSLEKGTNLLEIIPKLLMAFRKNAIGITADIRKAFLQISVVEKDRNYLKFLWWSNANDCKTLITFRHKRVVFGVTSSPFLLAATINHHLDNINDERKSIAQQLKKSFYVDNCVHSVNSDLECKEFVDVARALMNKAQFDLRGWVYGPSEVECTQSVLGLMWNNRDDVFYVAPEYHDVTEAITKRVLLSLAQRIFDPIGYTSPTALIPKVLLQRCWGLKLDWDDELPDDIKKEFSVWFREIGVIRSIFIPRRLTDFPVNNCKLSIHTFCDACKYAYAACVFLRSEYEDRVQVRLTTAKARVAPVKPMTIPRLELISAVIGVRLYHQVVSALGLSDVEAVFWTDSTVALTWIKRESNWSVFVHNRVKEIHKATNKSQWFHIAGPMNPADLPSRGCSPEKLNASNWWMGPEWLYSSSDHWPRSNLVFDDEVAKGEVGEVVAITTEGEHFSDRFSYFSKYSKIVRCIGWILRFANNCKYRNDIRPSNLTYDEYQNSEKVLLKLIQVECYDVASASPVLGLETLILDDGLIHVKSRLLLGDEPDTFKYPILVPGNHFIIHRLIYQNHCKLQHAGVTIVLSKLREFYWLTRARRNVKNVISKCSICKRFTCRAAQAPTAPLPENRIRTGKVFEVVGVDFAGPLYLKSGDKCWIVLFTCAVFRAVHLELTMSLSTQSFLMAFRRFVGRRGRVRVVYSDNGTNFVGASNLFAELDWDYLKNQLSIEKIEWKFNVPSAPWWGGFWERLIRCLKDLLRRILGKAALTYIELETVLVDCEATLNSRPLTYISDEDSLRPLTPMNFLHDLPSNQVQDLDNIDERSVNVRHRYIQNIRNDLRERFRKEYLGLLVHRRTSRQRETILKEGDVVMIEAEEKRQFWPIGIVVKLISGVDRVSRAAVVRV